MNPHDPDTRVHAWCPVCGDPFNDFEWHRRHTHPDTGDDIHEHCCPHPDCQEETPAHA